MKNELHWSEEVEQRVIAHRKRNVERFQAIIIRDAARQAKAMFIAQEKAAGRWP